MEKKAHDTVKFFRRIATEMKHSRTDTPNVVACIVRWNEVWQLSLTVCSKKTAHSSGVAEKVTRGHNVMAVLRWCKAILLWILPSLTCSLSFPVFHFSRAANCAHAPTPTLNRERETPSTTRTDSIIPANDARAVTSGADTKFLLRPLERKFSFLDKK